MNNKLLYPFEVLGRFFLCYKNRTLPHNKIKRLLKSPNFIGKTTAVSMMMKLTRKVKVAYFGEFGYELIAIIPYAYWLFLNNKLFATESTNDTKCLYYFSPNHKEVRDKPRAYIEPTAFPISNIYIPYLDSTLWNPPPYKEKYRNDRFVWDKPLCIISNKYSVEWLGSPINYISLDVLEDIIVSLKEKYQIIYNRPTSSDITVDEQTIFHFEDHRLIQQKFPEVITIQQLAEQCGDLTFNSLQLKLYANCEKFISVQGGGSVLSSYFGGTNVIYAKAGQELEAGSFDNWYNKFSGCKIYHTDDYKELISLIKKLF